MSAVAPPRPVPAGSSSALRIVLLGPPGAGKTALLAALGQVQRSQPDLFEGELFPGAHPSLQVADESTSPGTAIHPLRYHPESGESLDFVLIDAEGTQAQALFHQRGSLYNLVQQQPLLREVLHADTLVVLVDASLPGEQRGDFFVELARFLRQLELQRSQRSEMGGLPVVLVLTHCDKLVVPGQTFVDWMEAIEEQKRQVHEQFRVLLESGSPARPTSFGRLDLHIWAASVVRPPLHGGAARAEPYGVAELFRQCVQHAATFRKRRRRSGRQLLWTALLAVLVLTGLGLATLALMGGMSGAPPSELEQRVTSWIQREGNLSLALRLRGLPPALRKREKDLADIRAHPDFDQLPHEQRVLLDQRLNELRDYIPYLEKLLSSRSPAVAQNDDELTAIEKDLNGLLELPVPSWNDTDAGQLRQQRLNDVKRVREQIQVAEKWYDAQRRQGRELWTFHHTPAQGPLLNWRLWQVDAEEYLKTSESFPTDLLNLPPTSLVTAQTILGFARTEQAHEQAMEARTQVEALLDIACALRLAEPSERRPALLVIPRPPGFPARLAADRLNKLARAYPRYDQEFQLHQVSDAALPAVTQAARTSYEFLVPGAQDVLRLQYQQTIATPATAAARWRVVGAWLADDPEELRAWRQLAVILKRLHDKPARDPVATLITFLKQERYPLTLEQFIVDIPDHINLKIDVKTILTVRHEQQSIPFKQEGGGGQHDERTRSTRYTFHRERTALIYRPGDRLEVEVPLADEDRLLWQECRTRAYAFECVLLAPRLVRKGQTVENGILARDIRLHAAPADGIPPLPDLLPTIP